MQKLQSSLDASRDRCRLSFLPHPGLGVASDAAARCLNRNWDAVVPTPTWAASRIAGGIRPKLRQRESAEPLEQAVS
jgi:hypothetical protein